MIADLERDLTALEEEGRAAISAAATPDELEAARIRLLGRKEGRLTAIMRGLGGLSPEERPVAGARANRVKEALTALLDAREQELASADVTLLPANEGDDRSS